MSAAPPTPRPRLRPRDGREQATTSVELFFDLVYVFAVTQLSHHLLGDLTWAGAGTTAFLLVVAWWAWIYTTWMANWFDPGHTAVRLVLVGVMLASLLMAAAVPTALEGDGALFALAYVGLQVGRNLAGAALLPRATALRDLFERILAWSLASGVLWVAGGLAASGHRLAFWGPALAVDLLAPLAGYRLPGRGRGDIAGHAIDGGHFAERCQGFVIIALGESIVVTGATASDAGLGGSVVPALVAAFVGTAALWWLYFADVAANSRRDLAASDHAEALARDAYTYGHLPIVAGVILTAVGDDLVIAHPGHALSTSGVLMVCGGPLLFLAGEGLFRLRMRGDVSPRRMATLAALALAAAAGGAVSALALAAIVAGILSGLALWEARAS